MDFCHIVPTAHLDLVQNYPAHLVLAHLVEQDEEYTKFYNFQKFLCDGKNTTLILDNSAFEMYKQGRPMYPSDKLIEMGNKVKADYIVMTDYPAEKSQKTIDSAINLAPKFKEAGFKTFFVPQSEIGDLDDYISCVDWAVNHPELVDYIGISILGVPNAFGVEKNNKLQRFMARWKMMHMLDQLGILSKFICNQQQKIHFLGMVDGPNEIQLMEPFVGCIDTWDSSAAVWAGLNGISFDKSPTGLINGKFELEVDFAHKCLDDSLLQLARENMWYIDNASAISL